MALLVWLPLNGDLNNRGVSNVSITNNGATVDASGKFGSCYYFNGSSYIQISIPNALKTIKNSSVCAWVKCMSSVVGLGGISNDVDYTVAQMTLYTSGWQFGGNTYYVYISGGTVANTQVWHHVCCTCSNNMITTYLDGNVVATNTLSGLGVAVTELASSNFIEIGCDHPGGNEYLTGYVNDFRIYNHCLSTKEVKEISQGLFLHYKMNIPKSTGIGNTNLVANGWGGTDNWAYTGSAYVMTDVPSGTTITNSYGNDNYTKQYIPIIGNHSYTISEYVKKQSQSTCYVSLIPYDVDFNRINHHQERDGFRASSLTTLSQDLKNGDIIVHLTNASGWANPSTYEVEVAIFGYKDSTGYVYPDLEYTRTILRYASTTDKSNLDIANNKVTLISAYSGDTIPAGTSVCLSSWGSTYYYPVTCPASQAEDWKQISATITPQNINYLKHAKYLRVTTMNGYNYVSGVTIKDNTAGSVIYDTSDYDNDGTLYGDFTADSISSRYDSALVFDGGNTSIKIGNLANMIHDGTFTFSCWIKVSSFGSKGWGTIFGGPSGFEYQSKRSGTNSPVLVAYSWGQSSEGGQSYELNKWNMVTMVRTTSNCKFYLNGSLYYTGSAGSIPSGDYFVGAWRSYSEQNYKGSISDVRLYCTALSDIDVMDLYTTSAAIDNLGEVSCYELNESNVNTEILQNGYIDTKNIMESHPYIYLPAGTYVDTNLYYNNSDVCKAITVIRYAEGGSGRDLMGYSGSGAGYWGVTASGVWEPHGTFSYTNSDITKLNIVSYQFSSSSEHGYYRIGCLGGSYTVRNKYIYNVKLYKNGVLHRNMFPYMNGSTPGMLDVYNNVFYPVTGSNAVVTNDDEDYIAKIYDSHVKASQFIEI